MTVKQKKFANAYIISGNATEAAIKAGYAQKAAAQMGAENLKKPQVKAYVEARMRDLESAAIATQDEVLCYLSSVVRGESLSEVVVTELVGGGQSEARRIQKAPDERERLKAAELLGKRYGIFTDRKEVTMEIPVLFEGEDEIPD